MERNIEEFLKQHMGRIDDYTPYSEEILHEFLLLGALHYFIPTELGGRGENAESYLEVVEAASYYSVPLGLTLGIAGTLFLMPAVKYAAPGVRDPVIADFLENPAMGGIMITEPTGGTDIFGLNTCYEQNGDSLRLNGVKCWGGLTGKAGHWLVAARQKRGDRLTRKLNLLYVPLASEGVEVRTYFDALGLQPITYGQTHFENVELPVSHMMAAGKSGLRAVYDTLFRSRLGMPAIASGLCKRLVHEVEERTAARFTFGNRVADYDQVRYRLSVLKGFREINDRLWRRNAGWMDEHDDVSGDYTLVNSAKVICSETMQAAADSAVQIFAAASYKRNHLIGRAFVDSRPFQIFEGSNDVLHENTYEAIASRYGRCDGAAIAADFHQYGLSLPEDAPRAALALFDGGGERSQRQKVHLGRIVAWMFALSLLRDSAGEDTLRLIEGKIAELVAMMSYLG